MQMRKPLCCILTLMILCACGAPQAAEPENASDQNGLIQTPTPAPAPTVEAIASAGANPKEPEAVGFSDVHDDDFFAEALHWAESNGWNPGRSDTMFGPEDPMTLGDAAAMLLRFSGHQIAARLGEPDPGGNAMDAGAALRWCREHALISEPPGTVFSPAHPCSHAELITLLWRGRGYDTTDHQPWDDAACAWAERYGLLEDTGPVKWEDICPRAWALCYFYRDSVSDAPYDYAQPVPASAAVSPEWFDDAVFVGDSVTVRLNVYCASSGALSNARFLAGLNWNAGNAPVVDEIAAYGAKKVYIMLGINDMAYDFERVIRNMETLVARILERAPKAEIFIESVTPMTEASGRADEDLNNDVIREYNARMRKLCVENGWYYVDVASAVMDQGGYLIREYSGDADSMGIHFNTEGSRVWAEYLLTHVPEHLKYTVEEEA